MPQADTCCTIVPYFKVHEGKLHAFREGCNAFVERTREEPGCMYYSFCFSGDVVHCREGYRDAEALLAHLENVGQLLQDALKISDLTRLEIHAPAGELDKLRAPLSAMKPRFFTVELGFRH